MAVASRASILEALDLLDAAVDELLDASSDGLSCRDLVDVLTRLEVAGRRIPVVGHTLITRLSREATVEDLAGSPLRITLASRLMISPGEAKRRCEDAAALAPRVGLTGEAREPLLPHTAAALARGDLGQAQITIIRDTLEHLPQQTPPETIVAAEEQLTHYGAQFRPDVFRKVARRILDTIHPDGQLDDRARSRRRGITISAQGTDGMSRLSGWITPELRATLEPGLHKLAAPGMCNPDDQIPCTSGTPSEAQIQGDARNAAQRNHDALLAICRSLLMSGELGRHHGLPVTVIVSTTLQDLERGAGRGLTAGGSLLPMSDVIRMASHAHHYLCIFDKASDLPLNLYRTRRCASEGQRIVLHARDRGCTGPGCSAPAYLCEVHHIDDFADGGNTNIDDLTLACIPTHHKLIKPGGWRTRRAAGGRVEWIPPPEQDRGQPRTNDYHHPERLLGQED
ncbi:MAG: HNH endonuclease signature motif containing protein [Mycobacterium sp.]